MVVKYEKLSHRRLLTCCPQRKRAGKFKFVLPISFTIIYTDIYETKGEFATKKRIFWADRKKNFV